MQATNEFNQLGKCKSVISRLHIWYSSHNGNQILKLNVRRGSTAAARSSAYRATRKRRRSAATWTVATVRFPNPTSSFTHQSPLHWSLSPQIRVICSQNPRRLSRLPCPLPVTRSSAGPTRFDSSRRGRKESREPEEEPP
jgi:hypothetical protein